MFDPEKKELTTALNGGWVPDESPLSSTAYAHVGGKGTGSSEEQHVSFNQAPDKVLGGLATEHSSSLAQTTNGLMPRFGSIPPEAVSLDANANFSRILCNHILSPAGLPHEERTPEEEPITATIISDNTLSIQGELVILNENQLFVLNSLLLTREGRISANNILALGFGKAGTTKQIKLRALSRAMHELKDSLHRAASQSLIDIEGNKVRTTYQLSDKFTLSDNRPDDACFTQTNSQLKATADSILATSAQPTTAGTPSGRNDSKKQNTTKQHYGSTGGKESLELRAIEGIELRQQVISQIRKMYKAHPSVGNEVAKYREPKVNFNPVLTEDPLKNYLIFSGKYRLLKPKEEIALSRTLERGISVFSNCEKHQALTEAEKKALVDCAAAFEVLMNCNLGLVVSIAMKYKATHMDRMADLLQEGQLGLIKAISNYDHRLGFKLSTFATTSIWQIISRYIANTSRTIRIPAEKHKEWLDMISTRTHLKNKCYNLICWEER